MGSPTWRWCLGKETLTLGPWHVDPNLFVIGGNVHDIELVEDVGVRGTACDVEVQGVYGAGILVHTHTELRVVIKLHVIDRQADIGLAGEAASIGDGVVSSIGCDFRIYLLSRNCGEFPYVTLCVLDSTCTRLGSLSCATHPHIIMANTKIDLIDEIPIVGLVKDFI